MSTVLAADGTQTVVLTQPVSAPNGGGSWGPGERAGFPPELARSLITRGLARALTPDEERRVPETRAAADLAEVEDRLERHVPPLTIPARLREAKARWDKMHRGDQTK